MSRRDQIRMSDSEVAAFLEHERTVTCATNGPRGMPHLMPLWSVLREAPAGEPRPAALGLDVRQVPEGPEPRARPSRNAPGRGRRAVPGASWRDARVRRGAHGDFETVADLGGEILRRYAGPPGSQPPLELAPETAGDGRGAGRKRVGLEFVERRRVTWDHRKLAGVYSSTALIRAR